MVTKVKNIFHISLEQVTQTLSLINSFENPYQKARAKPRKGEELIFNLKQHWDEWIEWIDLRVSLMLFSCSTSYFHGN